MKLPVPWGNVATMRVNHTLDLFLEDCFVCGVTFAFPHELHSSLEKKGGSFYCPHGHKLTYGEGTYAEEKRRLEEQLSKERRRLKVARADRDRADRSAAAYKGQATKLRNRVKNGVCPCCNRSFANLRRHMATKHPTYVEAKI